MNPRYILAFFIKKAKKTAGSFGKEFKTCCVINELNVFPLDPLSLIFFL